MPECKFESVGGKEVYSGNIEDVATKEKSKFPQETFPEVCCLYFTLAVHECDIVMVTFLSPWLSSSNPGFISVQVVSQGFHAYTMEFKWNNL